VAESRAVDGESCLSTPTGACANTTWHDMTQFSAVVRKNGTVDALPLRLYVLCAGWFMRSDTFIFWYFADEPHLSMVVEAGERRERGRGRERGGWERESGG